MVNSRGAKDCYFLTYVQSYLLRRDEAARVIAQRSFPSESDRAVAIAMDGGKGRTRAEWLRRYDLRRVCVFCAQFFKAKEKRQGRKKMTGSERADRDGAR